MPYRRITLEKSATGEGSRGGHVMGHTASGEPIYQHQGIKFHHQEKDGRSGYHVESLSGSQYHITYRGSGDADPDYVALWSCDCPAGRYGKKCKHMTAFLDGDIANRHHDTEGE